MKLTESKLRQIIREEVRSHEYAERGLRAYKNDNRDKFIEELTNLLHAAGSLAMSDPETKKVFGDIQDIMWRVDKMK